MRLIKNMYKIYYLSSLNSDNIPCESICVCNEGDSLGTPLFQAGIYPLGVFLTKVIRIINSLSSTSKHSMRKELQLEDSFEKFDTNDYSFASIINTDSNARRILSLLLINKWNPNPKRTVSELFYLFDKYLDLINQCLSDKKLRNTKYLRIFSAQQNNSFPNHSMYISSVLQEDAISIFNFDSKVPYISKCKESTQKRLFGDTSSGTSSSETKWTPLMQPLDVYEIQDVIDLFLASLICIFENHYIVKKCEYCNNYFVTHRQKQKYCPFLFSVSPSHSCQRQRNIKIQLERESSGSLQMEKSLRAIYSNKYGSDTQDYRDLIDFFHSWRLLVNSGQKTEKEYVEILKTKYLKKYKTKGQL